MRKLTLAVALCLSLSLSASKESDRILNAADVLKEIMAAPDKGIPGDVMGRAACIAVIPSLKKLAIGFGGENGKGIVACRNRDGAWGPPSMLSITGGSFGLQLGAQSIDLVMVIMNRKGIDFLTRDKFEVGGDASAAAGPVGRDAQAGTNATADAEIYTYSRAKGLFAGISLKGAVVKPDVDGNAVIYGKHVDPRELLKDGKEAPPAAAAPFMKELHKYAPKK
jgi:lipid-binding SYLF domain-containing protein